MGTSPAYTDEDLYVPERAKNNSATASLRAPWNERLTPFHERLLSFTKLPRNWDSYGGKTTSLEAVEFVEKLVGQLGALFQLPELHPLPSGGIQVEWCSPQAEVLIEYRAPGKVSLLIESPAGVELEILDTTLTRLLQENSLSLARSIPRAL
jgi:hypothetical protein